MQPIKGNSVIKLHLGCGKRYLKGYIHIDAEVLPDEVYFNKKEGWLGSVTDLSRFGNNCIDEIYVSHLLDHLSRNEELDNTLEEWYRVLKPGGILRVAVSDFERVVKMYNEGLDLERLWGHIVGGHKSNYDKHGCVFDFNTLKKYLEKHGFNNVRRYKWQEVMPVDFDDLSMCYIPHMDKENGYLMSLNIEATK